MAKKKAKLENVSSLSPATGSSTDSTEKKDKAPKVNHKANNLHDGASKSDNKAPSQDEPRLRTFSSSSSIFDRQEDDFTLQEPDVFDEEAVLRSYANPNGALLDQSRLIGRRRSDSQTLGLGAGYDADYPSFKVAMKNVSWNVFLIVVTFICLLIAEFTEKEAWRHSLLGIGGSLGVVSILQTYGLGGDLHTNRNWRFFQPWRGGVRFVVFQILSWMFFGFLLLIPCTPWLLAPVFPAETFSGFIIMTGTIAVLSEVLMICSLLTYLPSHSQAPSPRGSATSISSREKRESLIEEVAPSTPVWTSFMAIQVLLSLVGCLLSYIVDSFAFSMSTRLILGLLTLTCLVLSLNLTYGVGGRWMYQEKVWNFYQPGQGGRKFVFLQGLTWAIFSLAIVNLIFNFWCHSISPIEHSHTCSVTLQYLPSVVYSGIAGFVAEILNIASLFFYDITQVDFTPSSPALFPSFSLKAIRYHPLIVWTVVLFYFNTEKAFIVIMVYWTSLAPLAPHVIVVMSVLLGALYLRTYLNGPSISGRRALRIFRGSFLFDYMAYYFDLRILSESERLDPQHRYIMGFHPHGILPLTCAWFNHTKEWVERFPGVEPAPLTSSIIHYIPIMRDILQLMNGFEVSRQGMINALNKSKSIIFVPGGQHEMIYSSSYINENFVSTRHKGFIKLALETAFESKEDQFLVPVFSFGEKNILDNLRFPHSMQRFCMTTLRANICFFPYGRFSLPGFPRPEPVAVGLATPIRVPRVEKLCEEHVNLLHRRYYSALFEMFEHFKGQCNRDREVMILDPPIEQLSQSDFEAEWRKITETDMANLKALQAPAAHHTKTANRTEEIFVGIAIAIWFCLILWVAYP